ncbi:MAG: hypothetical protein J7L89_07495, partial [Bacteroidales bacterium]|nr:hypothetical protein [Bacteroidales bacterium]
NTDDLDLTLDINIIKTNIGINFLDAATETLIGEDDDTRIKVTIYGKDADWVLDPSGSRFAEYYSSSGYLGLALDPYKAHPTVDNPVSFIAVVDIDGYVSTSLPVRIDSEGIHEYDLRLVSLINPPDGVSVTQDPNIGSVTDGVVQEDINISTDSDRAKISIDQGTVLLDQDGEPLEGNLNVDLVYFDPTKEGALEVFPGGMNVVVKNETGVEENVAFISAGFIALDIKDASGKKASNIKNDQIKIDMKIPSGLINPETGVEVAAGDKIPLWSYDNVDGQWAYEGEIEVSGIPQDLSASCNLSHLSYWNLDWKRQSCSRKYLIFAGDNSISGYTRYRLKARLTSGFGYLFSTTKRIAPGKKIKMVNIPTSPIEIYFAHSHNTCGVTDIWQMPSSFVWDFCANGDYTVQLTANQVSTVNMEIIIHCTDTNQDFVPKQWIKGRFRKQGNSCWTTVWISGGSKAIAGIESNTTYEIQAYYQGRWQPDPPFVQDVGTETTVIFRPAINCH